MMMICQVDTSPFFGIFDEFEATWCIHPLFLLPNPWAGPSGAGPTDSPVQKAGGYTTWPHVAHPTYQHQPDGDFLFLGITSTMYPPAIPLLNQWLFSIFGYGSVKKKRPFLASFSY